MPSLNETWPPLPSFEEERWLTTQERRGRFLHATMQAWFDAQVLDSSLRERLRPRLFAGESAGRIDSPATFAMAVAESLGAPAERLSRLGIAANLFWAAADVADDVDDRDASAGEAAEIQFANDSCAVLFLAQKALLEFSPEAAILGIEYGLRMSGGQFRDLTSTDRGFETDVAAIVRDKAGAELEFFFRLAALAASVPQESLGRLGCAFGEGLQLFSDVVDLYLKPVSDDFAAGKWTAPLRIYRAMAGESAARWQAFPRTWPDIQARVRFEAAAASTQALAPVIPRLLESRSTLSVPLREPHLLDDMLAWLTESIGAVQEALSMLEEPPAPSIPSIKRSVAMAAEFLAGTPMREEHRWGLFGESYVAGNLFTLIFRAAALSAAGSSETNHLVEQLVNLRDTDGWRYYPGRFEIPPDADDTGLILGHFAFALPPEVLVATAEQLIENFEGNSIHTWMGPADGVIEWTGNDCPSTLANACWGLLRNGYGDRIPEAVLNRLVDLALTANFASPFYPAAPTRFFIHRALAAAAGRALLPRKTAAVVREALLRELNTELRVGGNYSNSILAHACAILAGDQWGLVPDETAAIWLTSRQDVDGSWPAEPFFMMPGVDFRPKYWGHAGLTTAMCLMALSVFERGPQLKAV